MTTAQAVAKALADAGIDRVFGLPGGEVLVLIDELRRAGVDFVLMRHEANAGIAAAVYGKLRGQPGVVLTTLGPGAANLMLPLCERLSRSRAAARDLGADARRVSRQPHAPAAAAARVLPADRAAGREDHRRATSTRSCRARSPRAWSGRSALRTSRCRLAKRRSRRSVGGRAFTATASPDRPRRQCARTGGQRSRPRSRAPKRPLVVIGLGIDPANAARDPAVAERLESAGGRDAEGQGHRRRDRRQLRRRHRRDGRRRLDGATRFRRRIWSSASASTRWRSTRPGTPSGRFTGCSSRRMSAASCRPASSSSTTRAMLDALVEQPPPRSGRRRSRSFRSKRSGC